MNRRKLLRGAAAAAFMAAPAMQTLALLRDYGMPDGRNYVVETRTSMMSVDWLYDELTDVNHWWKIKVPG